MNLVFKKIFVVLLGCFLLLSVVEAKGVKGGKTFKGIKSPAVRKVISDTKNKVVGKVIPKTDKQKAREISSKFNNDKNSVLIKSFDKKNGKIKATRYDLKSSRADTHKGVPTPHKQYLYSNTNPKTKQTFLNETKSAKADPMNQKDFRIVRNYLKKKNKE